MALLFDATGDYLRRDTNAPDINGSVTVTFWYKPTALPGSGVYNCLFSIDTSLSDVWAAVLFGDTYPQQIILYEDQAGSPIMAAIGSALPSAGVWYFCAASRDGATEDTTGYQILQSAGAWSTATLTGTFNGHAAASSQRVWIGNYSGSEYANGAIAAVKIWTAALSADEIQRERYSYAPVRKANLWGYFPLNSPNDYWKDRGPNQYDMTPAGTLTWADNPPIPNPSIYIPAKELLLPVWMSGGGGISGMAATAQGNQSIAASGTETVFGSANLAQGSQSATGVGVHSQPATGTAATVQGGQSSSASGTETFSGAAATAQGSQSASASGTEILSGTATTAQGSQGIVASGIETLSGAATNGQGSQSVAADGTETLSGTATAAQGGQSIAAVGLFGDGVAGTAATAQGSQSAAASGAETLSGAVATAQGGQSATASGLHVIPVAGTAATAQGSQSVAASGAETMSGAAAAAQGSQSASATGAETLSGTAIAAQGGQSVAASGAETLSGIAATGQGGQSASASGLAASDAAGTAATAQGGQSAAGAGETVSDVTGEAATGQGSQSARGQQTSEATGGGFFPTRLFVPAPPAVAGNARTSQAQSARGRGGLTLVGGAATSQAQTATAAGKTDPYARARAEDAILLAMLLSRAA